MGWGAAIGGVASALGSMFSTNSANSAARENYKKRIRWTVKDARKAGINPYFALSTGAANAVPSAPRVASFTALTGAFDALDDVISGRDAQEDRNLELQNDLMAVELDQMRTEGGMQRSPRLASTQYSAPSVTGGTQPGAIATPPKPLGMLGAAGATEPGREIVTPVGDGSVISHPLHMDGEAAETRYGDPGLMSDPLYFYRSGRDAVFTRRVDEHVRQNPSETRETTVQRVIDERSTDFLPGFGSAIVGEVVQQYNDDPIRFPSVFSFEGEGATGLRGRSRN